MNKGLISNLFLKEESIVKITKEQIKKAYKEDQRPWVVGYSGGKDSTVVVQLVFESLLELNKSELTKKVYVISSDTLIETPLIINSINQTLTNIQNAAIQNNLPIETHKVKPEPKNSFWVNLIGRGYPSPNQTFRWCTDRLKIEPANSFIMNKVSTFGEVVMILGVREDESISRGNSIREHSIEGQTFMRHSTLSNAYVYAPIKAFSLDDVWDYLLSNPSPWGDDNFELHKLYQDSNSGECPLVVDKGTKESAGSCGNSRFGCWACTVVSEDKALTGFIQSGHSWMKPLLDFRNWLTTIRDDRSKRMKYRMNGQVYFRDVKIELDGVEKFVVIPKKASRPSSRLSIKKYNVIDKEKIQQYIQDNNIDLSKASDHSLLIRYEEEGLDGKKIEKYAQLGLGPYTIETRLEILEKLLLLQKDIKHPSDLNYKLISVDELKEIRRIWFKQGYFEDPIPYLYKSIFPNSDENIWERDDRPILDQAQLGQLEELCKDYQIDINVMKKLLNIEKNYLGYKFRRGLTEEIGKVLKQDYLHL